MTYNVFTRDAGRKTYLAYGVSLARARALRAAWNDLHPGNKAEFEEAAA